MEPAFDAYYFRHCCGQPYARTPEWLARFEAIADRIVADFAPRRVLDAGCAWGFLVEALRARGVEAFGLDLSPYAIEQVRPDMRSYCRVGSVADDLGEDYDLIVCMEVLEHMPSQDGERAITNLCAHTPDVLFSSSPHDFQEPTHVSVRPPEAWAEVFARAGAFRDVDYDAGYILPWATRFSRRSVPVARLVRDYERRYWFLQHAATEARAYAASVQGQLAAIDHERGAWTHELHVAHVEHHATAEQAKVREAEWQARLTQADAARAEADAARAEGDAARAEAEARAVSCEQQCQALAGVLAQAQDRITHMERSLFWRVRTAVHRLLGR